MQKPSDNPADPFKKALAEATKVMADDPELTVSFSVDPPGRNRDQSRRPSPTTNSTHRLVE
jgi:cobaltochelatase CobT